MAFSAGPRAEAPSSGPWWTLMLEGGLSSCLGDGKPVEAGKRLCGHPVGSCPGCVATCHSGDGQLRMGWRKCLYVHINILKRSMLRVYDYKHALSPFYSVSKETCFV